MSNMQLDTLRRIVQEINASTSLHESLDIMVNHVAEAMHVDVCSIYLLDERNQRYLLMASCMHMEEKLAKRLQGGCVRRLPKMVRFHTDTCMVRFHVLR